MQKYARFLIHFFLIALCLYGAGRLYFAVTAGFTLGNITGMPDVAPFGTSPLPEERAGETVSALGQSFHYLGKGCQSYVFESEDGRYVVKFLKLQRFRPQWYLHYLPVSNAYLFKKEEDKKRKLLSLLSSWKIAYEDLPEETGVLYFHLPQNQAPVDAIAIVDKSGLKRSVDPKETAFLLQRKATMLCPTIAKRMEQGDVEGAITLLDHLVAGLVQEYKRGYGDHDHALMQNTGVLEGQPIHIDVGQLAFEEQFKDPSVYKEELFSKTYKFRIWLSKRYPELERHLYSLLKQEIGPEIEQLKPKLKTVDEGA